MSAFSDATLQLINQQLQLRNNILREFAVKYKKTTWDDVQEQVKTGHAADYYSVGDELTCGYTDTNGNEYDFPWVVAGFKDVYWEGDDVAHPGMILQAKYATDESVQFDAPEDTTVDSSETEALDGWYYWGLKGTTYTALNLSTGDAIPHSGDYDSIHKCGVNDLSVLRNGYNRYLYSAQRQWLNSDALAGNWWESKHTGDKAPYTAGTINGFMHGLDEDFLDVINPVKIQVVANTVTDGGATDVMYDRFFLPSTEEMFGTPKAANVEGPYFPYWKTKTGLTTPSNQENNGRIIYGVDNHSSAQVCRLRSTVPYNSGSTYNLTISGNITTYGAAHLRYRCSPACIIS